MKYTNPLFIPLLFCSLLSCSMGLTTTSSYAYDQGKGGGEVHSSFPPSVDVRFEYSMGGPSFQPLYNGAILHSGQKYRIIVTPHQDCYIRVSQKDSTNKRTVFKEANNLRVIAGTTVELPEPQKAYKLDNTVGSETIVFEASFDELKGRLPDPVPIDDSSPQTVNGNYVKSVTFQHVN